ncbi:MAG: universal stress protein [Cyanobacteria bacterium J06588_5]
MITKILVAIDLKEDYTHVFSQALDLATATGADLHLLSVLTASHDYLMPSQYYLGTAYPTPLDDSFWSDTQAELKEIKERGHRTLSRLCDRASARGIQAAFSQVTGEPGQVICDRAKTQDFDLVIVGSHGRRGLGELLVGSVSSYVMHRAPCSVMIVHAKVSTVESTDESTDESTEDSADLLMA